MEHGLNEEVVGVHSLLACFEFFQLCAEECFMVGWQSVEVVFPSLYVPLPVVPVLSERQHNPAKAIITLVRRVLRFMLDDGEIVHFD